MLERSLVRWKMAATDIDSLLLTISLPNTSCVIRGATVCKSILLEIY